MPHQCTNCGRRFADGSKEMLSGCPDCGGNKFQFAPSAAAAAESFDEGGDSSSVSTTAAGATAVDSSESTDATDAGDRSPSSDSSSVTTRAAKTVREWVSTDSADPPADDPVDVSENTGRGGSEPVGQPESARSPTSSRSNRPWPTAENAESPTGSPPSGGEFPEWPETARRPEDRSESSSEDPRDGREDRGDSNTERSDRSSGASTASIANDENSAQADARSEIVPTDDLPSHSGRTDHSDAERRVDAGTGHSVEPPGDVGPTDVETDDGTHPDHGRVISEPNGERPSIEDLRAELNEQFESIKIVSPGQYELNLMELYNRDEYIISLQEDGRYVIEVPDSWRAGDDEDG